MSNSVATNVKQSLDKVMNARPSNSDYLSDALTKFNSARDGARLSGKGEGRNARGAEKRAPL